MSSNKAQEKGRFQQTANDLVMLEQAKKILAGMVKKENHDKRVVIPIGVIDYEENIRSEIPENGAFFALAESIQKLGLLQPLVVTPYKGKIKLVSGHRRLKAVRGAGWENVPVIVKHLDYEKDFTLAQLVENVNREELSPVDHSEALLLLKQKGKYSNKEVGKIVGLHEKYINSLINIAKMPVEAKNFARKNKISVTTLKEIVKTKDGKDPQKIMLLLQMAVSGKKPDPDDRNQKKKTSPAVLPPPIKDWFAEKNFSLNKTSQARLEKVGRMVYLMTDEERAMALELVQSLPKGALGSLNSAEEKGA